MASPRAITLRVRRLRHTQVSQIAGDRGAQDAANAAATEELPPTSESSLTSIEAPSADHSKTPARPSRRRRAKSKPAAAASDDEVNVASGVGGAGNVAEPPEAGHGDGDRDGDAPGDNDADKDDAGEAEDNESGAADDDEEDDNEGTGVDAEGYKTITVKGKVYRLDGDEVVLDSDPEGDKKVDAKGRLQGDRNYKTYNFTSDQRGDPERVYMLSIDAARAAGYRDSLYFFRKNPMIIKITLNQSEKDKLIEDGRLSGQLKTRNVTMVAVRNVYKLHGARFLSGGKAVIDDYYEAAARASGAKEGKTVGGMTLKEQEKKKEADRDRDRSRRRPDAFSHTTYDSQGEVVVTVFGDAGQTPFVRAGTWATRRAILQRADVTEENWMLEMARSVRGMNTELAETRRERLAAFRRFDEASLDAGEAASVEPLAGEAEPEEDEEAEHDRPPWEREGSAEAEESARKRKTAAAQRQSAKRQRGPPIGIFEPSTHMPHFSLNTQPAWARLEKVSPRPRFVNDVARDGGSTRPILGGDRLGSAAWGLASFSTEMVAPPPLPPYQRIAGGLTESEGGAPSGWS